MPVEGVGQREVDIEWLRDAFQLGDKYPAIKDFKRRVIDPAVTQINEHSPLWVQWDQRKTGRRVSHLVFIFGDKSPQKPKASAGQKLHSKKKLAPRGHSLASPERSSSKALNQGKATTMPLYAF